MWDVGWRRLPHIFSRWVNEFNIGIDAAAVVHWYTVCVHTPLAAHNVAKYTWIGRAHKKIKWKQLYNRRCAYEEPRRTTFLIFSFLAYFCRCVCVSTLLVLVHRSGRHVSTLWLGIAINKPPNAKKRKKKMKMANRLVRWIVLQVEHAFNNDGGGDDDVDWSLRMHAHS